MSFIRTVNGKPRPMPGSPPAELMYEILTVNYSVPESKLALVPGPVPLLFIDPTAITPQLQFFIDGQKLWKKWFNRGLYGGVKALGLNVTLTWVSHDDALDPDGSEQLWRHMTKSSSSVTSEVSGTVPGLCDVSISQVFEAQYWPNGSLIQYNSAGYTARVQQLVSHFDEPCGAISTYYQGSGVGAWGGTGIASGTSPGLVTTTKTVTPLSLNSRVRHTKEFSGWRLICGPNLIGRLQVWSYWDGTGIVDSVGYNVTARDNVVDYLNEVSALIADRNERDKLDREIGKLAASETTLIGAGYVPQSIDLLALSADTRQYTWDQVLAHPPDGWDQAKFDSASARLRGSWVPIAGTDETLAGEPVVSIKEAFNLEDGDQIALVSDMAVETPPIYEVRRLRVGAEPQLLMAGDAGDIAASVSALRGAGFAVSLTEVDPRDLDLLSSSSSGSTVKTGSGTPAGALGLLLISGVANDAPDDQLVVTRTIFVNPGLGNYGG